MASPKGEANLYPWNAHAKVEWASAASRRSEKRTDDRGEIAGADALEFRPTEDVKVEGGVPVEGILRHMEDMVDQRPFLAVCVRGEYHELANVAKHRHGTGIVQVGRHSGTSTR